MIKNKVFYVKDARVNLFASDYDKLNHIRLGLCIEKGKGQQYKSLWFSLGKFTFRYHKNMPGFFHIQGLFVAISLSY